MIMANDPSSFPLEPPRAVPHLGIPVSSRIVDLRIINTTSYTRTKTSNLFSRPVPGHDILSFPSYAFLVTNKRLKVNILFDLGMRKDWRNACSPLLQQFVSDYDNNAQLRVSVERDVRDILDADLGNLGITSRSISAVVWSHHHFDHRGDMSRFPPYTKLITGPGLLSTYATGNSQAEVFESDYVGREVVELGSKDFTIDIGGYPAHDAFGDGSFYLLNCPGHAVGHLAGLARVSSGQQSSFVFLGGDCAHHCGEFRPSPYAPLPQQLAFKSATWAFDDAPLPSPPILTARRPMICAGEFIKDVVHPRKSATESFYNIPREPLIHSREHASDSVTKMEIFDAHDDVLVCISHDPALMSVLPFYPYTMNDWQRRGYKQRLRWEFLKDFDLEGDSLYKPRRRLY